MIKKAILITCCLFITYNILLIFLPPKMGQEVNIDGLNITKAQSYLYDIQNISEKEVLVGTSLTGIIEESKISPNFINLGLDAMTALDGLAIIFEKKEWPKSVFIEVNLLNKFPTPQFQKFLFNPTNRFATKYIPSSRKQNQPIEIFKRSIFEFYRILVPNEGADPNRYNITIKEEVLQNLVSTFNTPFREETLNSTFERFLPYFEELIANNVKIVFYEMPWHPSICPSNRIIQLRKAIKNRLPTQQFEYIQQPYCASYQTIEDGIHLTIASGEQYAIYLKEKIKL